MVQKKSEAVTEEEVVATEEPTSTGVFVDSVWNRYEQSIERGRQIRERSEDAYINALKEVVQFNKQYRKSFVSIFEQSRRTNRKMVKGLLGNYSRRRETEANTPESSERTELNGQLRDVSKKVENLALTPLKSTLNMLDQFEDSIQKSVESNVAYVRNRRREWHKVTDGYVQLVRNNHRKAVVRSVEGLKGIVKNGGETPNKMAKAK
ncbi:hypothetical protein [Bacillus sp. V5-8f]|uniref:hypothetical protein n=1 Tax=Bacillus sp. V5-8f TaxID=2053044 RepID=UPI0015E0E92D|nr:hypothetical protein [Bacillus sp. V5-8f]